MIDDNGSEARIVIFDDKGREDAKLTAEFREFLSNNGGSLGVELYPGTVHKILKHVAEEFEEQIGCPFATNIKVEVVTQRQLSEIPQENIETRSCRLMVSAV